MYVLHSGQGVCPFSEWSVMLALKKVRTFKALSKLFQTSKCASVSGSQKISGALNWQHVFTHRFELNSDSKVHGWQCTYGWSIGWYTPILRSAGALPGASSTPQLGERPAFKVARGLCIQFELLHKLEELGRRWEAHLDQSIAHHCQ